jgi:hypothetical protein
MTTATQTKLSKKTLGLLKNYSSINSNILVKPGSTISTISPVKNVMSQSKVEETFDVQFGIWDLNKFLGVVSLFENPTFEFNEKYVDIENGNGSSVRYYYCEPSLLTVPTKSITMPDSVVSFDLSKSVLSEVLRASSILQASDLAVRSNDGKVELVVMDKADVSSNTYSIDVDETTDADFAFYFKVENLKMVDGSYTVDISDKNISQFTNKGTDTTYWIALETDSKYNG